MVDPVTRKVAADATTIVDRARARLGTRVSGEITKLQVETKTEPCTSTRELTGQLIEARRVVADCARADGLRIMASGTPVLSGAVPPPITEGPRQARGMATYRGLHDEQSICAVHVHVELPDRDRALKVSNHLRPLLPTLITLTANSPYWEGRDTGYASWRTVTWSRWPVAGPPPYFTSAAHYDQVVRTLSDAGALVDAGTIFWDVRPSPRQPTLEIRVADVPITPQESAAFAALVRALVVAAGEAVDRGEPGPAVRDELMRVAYWQAARDGIWGSGLDVSTGCLVPAAQLVHRLVDSVRPVLTEFGDDELVADWTRRWCADGTGAVRQRTAAGRRGQLTDTVDHLIEQTAPLAG
ncbi:glutamate--cysteine ligase [Micromonospora sonneratiae]